eukprot:2067198-Ditylum_brightwellii.AAC.1
MDGETIAKDDIIDATPPPTNENDADDLSYSPRNNFSIHNIMDTAIAGVYETENNKNDDNGNENNTEDNENEFENELENNDEDEQDPTILANSTNIEEEEAKDDNIVEPIENEMNEETTTCAKKPTMKRGNETNKGKNNGP